MDADGGSKTVIDARAYWFNDMDYHGVDPAKRFRYSVRVDGVFEPDFVRRVQAGVLSRDK
jgi:Rieske 2Fe-2S family protein